MLSKLFHCDVPDFQNQARHDLVFTALLNELQQIYENVSISVCRPGGTLGVFAYAEMNGKQRFVKTHLPGEMYQHNICKEYEILNLLYRDCLFIERRDVSVNGYDYTFLIMDRLEELKQPLSIVEMKNVIYDYTEKLKIVDTIDGMYTFPQIYEEGVRALELLLHNNLINTDIANKCGIKIKSLETTSKQTHDVVCHGDLSNKNIMLLGNKPIVLDWEDSFIGVKDYDLCYWLTFFDQRKYYNQDMPGLCRIDSNRIVAFMVLITVLKCYLSYKNGSFKSHSVTFDQRLDEILALEF